MVCGICSSIGNLTHFITDVLTPSEIPKECSDKRVYAIIQNVSVCTGFVALISSIFCIAMASIPFFLLSLGTMGISFGASHIFKKLASIPTPPLSQEVANKMSKTAIAGAKHFSPQMDGDFAKRLADHGQMAVRPETVAEERKKDLQTDFQKDPTPLTQEERTDLRKSTQELDEKMQRWEGLLSDEPEPTEETGDFDLTPEEANDWIKEMDELERSLSAPQRGRF